MSQETAPLACPACRIIDQADGVEDGNLFATLARHIEHESKIIKELKHLEDRVADKITSFAGSMQFVYIHSVWFVVWIVLNLGIIGAGVAFDKFPFGLLTMIVSLEAIFLATFVMVSQNRQAARADIRARLDFETNLRAEIWAVHIGQAVGVDPAHVEAVSKMAVDGSRKELDNATG